jgi:hypothetical protein
MFLVGENRGCKRFSLGFEPTHQKINETYQIKEILVNFEPTKTIKKSFS